MSRDAVGPAVTARLDDAPPRRAAAFVGGRLAFERRLVFEEVSRRVAAAASNEVETGGLVGLLGRSRSAWRAAFVQFQRLLQDGDLAAANALAPLLETARPDRSADVIALLAAFTTAAAPTPALDRLAALLAAQAREPDAPPPDDWPATLDAALAEARRLPAAGRQLDASVLQLVRWPGLGPRAAATGLELLGYAAPPAATVAALVGGSRAPEVLLHLAVLAETPREIEALFADAPPADWLSAMDALAVAGFLPAARAILRCCVVHGAAPPGDVLRLLRIEADAADGLDPLEVLDAAVLLDPAAWLLRVERAKLLASRGLLPAALAEAEAVLAAPTEQLTLDVAIGAADLLHGHGRGAAGVAGLAALAQHYRTSPRLLGRAATGLLAAGDVSAAEPLLRQAIAATEDAAERRPLAVQLARLMVANERSRQAVGMLRPLLAEDPSAELLAAFVDAMIPVIWRSVPDYVDWGLVAELEAALDQASDLLHPDRLLDGVRLFLALDRPLVSHRLLEAVLPHLPEGGAFRPGIALRQMVEEFGLQGVVPADESPVDAAVLGRALHGHGLGLLAARRLARAQICFRLAARLAPDDPAARFNAGFGAIANGQMQAALGLFDGRDRIYEPDMARVAWPVVGGLPWPLGVADLGPAFEALKPEGEEWPAITVITPSYNQAAYIEETILSVLRQGYPRLQYIVVDGLSNDGSVEVIERYSAQIDTVIIEKDRGQTEAINKGLRLANGEIITWINSDDMLAPGALHMLALAWMRSRADILFGFCLPHRDHGFVLANLPQVRADTFTPQHLGEIFTYWMKGYFFYQPEVVFSRRILEQAGGLLDQELYFTMDYEFWLRCAKAGAKVEAVTWPVALFRQHSEQKTANLLDCMLEQAQVRDQFVRIAPPPAREADIRARLRAALDQARPRIGVVSSRLSKIFSGDVAPHLTVQAAAAGFEVSLLDTAARLPAGSVDILVKLVHLQSDVEELQALRDGGFAGPVVGWFWDNHHHLFANFDVAEQLDIVMPGHAFARHYLANTRALSGPSVPLCVTQWSAREAASFWARCRDLPRSDRLYGGFVRYAFARKRNALIERLITAGFDGVYFLEEHALDRYFGLPLEDRFREWAGHKVSITLPLAGDLSQRCFDALLCGQVPIVPSDVVDLDAVVPPDLQASLPIIRFDRYDPAAVMEAHERALAAFDAGGPEAAEARHRFALDGHTFEARMLDIAARLRSLAAEGGSA